MIYTPAPPRPIDNNGRPLCYHRAGNEWLSQANDQLLIPYEIETEEQKTAAAKYIEWANGSD